MKRGSASILLVLVALAPPASAAPVVRSGTGANTAALTAVRDLFRADVGGGPTAGANGAFGGLRREINWDAVPSLASAPNNLPANFFNVNSPRGVVFSSPGSGFQVSGATTDPMPASPNFGNINPSYTATFTTFSPQRLFTALGSTVTDVNFFLPGTSTTAAVAAFGAVFTDVDTANATGVQYFNEAGASLGTFFAPPLSGGLSFVGVKFDAGTNVSKVRITSGNAALGAGVLDNPPATDLVVMDDFIYSEPQLPVPATVPPPPANTDSSAATADAPAPPAAPKTIQQRIDSLLGVNGGPKRCAGKAGRGLGVVLCGGKGLGLKGFLVNGPAVTTATISGTERPPKAKKGTSSTYVPALGPVKVAAAPGADARFTLKPSQQLAAALRKALKLKKAVSRRPTVTVVAGAEKLTLAAKLSSSR